MNVLTLIIIAVILMVFVVGVFLGTLLVSLLIYATSRLHTWPQKIAVWEANVENLFPLVLLTVLLIIPIMLGAALLHATLPLLLILFTVLLFSPSVLVWSYVSSGLLDGLVATGESRRWSAFTLPYVCRLSIQDKG
jgi:hypothetical protein